MTITWLQSLIYSLLTGITSLLPVSAEAHQTLFMQLSGLNEVPAYLQLTVHLGILVALLISCREFIGDYRVAHHLASLPASRRKRQPDREVMLTMRNLQIMILPVALSLFAHSYVSWIGQKQWLLPLVLICNGLILFIPQYLPGANKVSQNMSALDALLMGFGYALGTVPGISPVGFMVAFGRMRGVDKLHAVNLSLLLSIPVTIIWLLMDLFSMYGAGMNVSFLAIFSSVCAATFSALFAIALMRNFARNGGLSAFAYYSWGAAMFIFILYLTI